MTIQDCIQIGRKKLKKHLWSMPGAITGKDYALLPGDRGSPFMLIAHIDTLHRPGIRLRQSKDGIISNDFGLLGADDRAGVYSCLEVYHKAPVGKKPYVLFTDGEETGGIGASEASLSIALPESVRLLLELDRQGASEYVTYDEMPVKVMDYIESFGFYESLGSYSDIADLSPSWQVPAVNLSVGYHKQHTPLEYLSIPEMRHTISRVLQMLSAPIKKRYKLPIVTRYRWGVGKNDTYYGYSDDFPVDTARAWGDTTFRNCELCGSFADYPYDFQGLKVCGQCWDYVTGRAYTN